MLFDFRDMSLRTLESNETKRKYHQEYTPFTTAIKKTHIFFFCCVLYLLGSFYYYFFLFLIQLPSAFQFKRIECYHVVNKVRAVGKTIAFVLFILSA